MPLRGTAATQLAFYSVVALLVVLLATRILPAYEFLATVDWRFLLLLGSFMLLAEGMKSAGFVDWFAAVMSRWAYGPEGLYLLVLTSSFVLAMLVTNDAALFATIPFTIALARRTRLHLRRLVIYEIMAVNLGSAFTPWGNPQNLFIYHHYHLSPLAFFRESIPFAGISFAAISLLVLGNLIFATRRALTSPPEAVSEPRVSWGRSGILLAIFALLVLSVLRWIPVLLPAGCLVLYTGTMARDGFKRLDWFLLGTFFLLFPAMSGLGGLLARAFGGEISNPLSVYGIGIGISQLISNVPGVMLLSHATEDWRSLYYGVNIGGLGTVVASFANLIGLSLYLNGVKEDGWKAFLGESLGWNALLLVALGGIFTLFVG